MGIGLATVLAALAWPGGPVADTLTLHDGTVILGETVGPPGRANVIRVRRAWAREHAPRWLPAWEKAERTAALRAAVQRRTRLQAWRKERERPPVLPAANDRITAWIDRELERLRQPETLPEAPVVTVHLLPTEIRGVKHRDRAAEGLLRTGWLLGFREPEAMSADALAEAIEGRGLDPARAASTPLDGLVAAQNETDAVWLARRAATEVQFDPGLRYLRYQGMLLPDRDDSGGNRAMPALQAAPLIGALITGQTNDPLPERQRSTAAWGRVGLLVTGLDVSPDFATVQVQMTLWVRHPGDRWAPAGSRVARVRSDDLPAEAGQDLAADPQVAMAFRLIEAVGMKEVAPEFRRRALKVGHATRKALGQVKAEADADFARLVLPVTEAPAEAR